MAEKYNYDDDKIIFGTSDNDRIFNGNEVLYGSTTAYKTGGDRVTIQSMAGNDYIYNYSNHTEINSGTSDDTIENHGFKVNIVTSEGNDSVLSGGNDVTISTGIGNDTIYNITGYNASINAGAGDDVITNGDYILHYDNVTIMAGRGHDKINLSEESSLYNLLQYMDGDGNDTVYGYNFNDTIQIINGLYTTTTSGNDVIINVGNGKITLKNAKDKQLNITTITMNIDDTSDEGNNRQENLKIPSDAFIYKRHSYKVYQNGMTWHDAKTFCENLGGHLVTITDSGEQTFVKSLLENEQTPKNSYWMGGYKDSSNKWIWTTGEPWYYSSWGYNQPDGDGKALMMYCSTANGWKLGDWNDIPDDGNGIWGDRAFFTTDKFGFICEWDNISQNDDIEIDEATALEVINLFKGMDASEKKTTLKENLETLESLKIIIEGDKKIEIKDEETGKSYFTDSKNLIETLKACYDDDAPEWLTEYTKYVHDFKGHIVYKSYYLKDQDGHFIYDSEGNPIRFFELDANNNRIPVEYNSKLRDAASNTLGITFDIYSASESIEKLLYEDLNVVQKTAEISKLSGNVVSITGAIRQLGGFDKAGTIAPIASAFLGLTGSIISLCDGIKSEEVVDVVQKALESATILSKYALEPEFATTKIGTLLGGNSFVTKKLKPVAESFNANALKVNLGVAIALGLVMGGVQYFKSNEQYQIDGLKDSQAIKDKWTDTFTTGMKTFYNTVTLGLDDAAFGILSAGAANAVYGIEWIWTAITGGDVSKVKKMSTGGKNYMELFGDFVKLVFLNQYTDPNGDENGYMENTKVGRNIYSGGGNDSINNKASKANIYSGTGNDVIFCSEGTNQQYIDGGNDKDHIALYGSSNEIHGGLGDDQIDIFGDNKNPASGNYILGEAGNDYIWIGDGKSKKTSSTANSIDGGAGDDVIFIDQTKTPNIIFYNNGDGNDEIFGYDSNDKIRINKSDYSTIESGDDVKIIVGNGSMILYDAKDKKLNITRTDIDIMPTGMTADKNKTTLTISNKFKAQNIYLENYDKSFTKVNASGLAKTQSIEIKGNSSSNSLKGGKGDDTINGSTGNNTLIGGAGNDVFIYASGNDVITDYKPGEDKINLNVASITKSSVKGSDVVLTTTKGTVSIKGAKDKIVTFVDDNSATTEKIFFADTFYSPLATGLTYDSTKRIVLTASNKFTGSEINLNNYLSTVTKVNASAVSQTLKIIGNSSDNSLKGGKNSDTISGGTGKDTIFGGNGNDSILGGVDNDLLKGDAGNDTLNGGSGNDTLTGGAGNDVFVYESGNDTITDYKSAEDKIKWNPSSITNSTVKGSDVILTTNNGTLTVKGTKDKIITFIDDNGKTTDKIFFSNTSYAPLATGLSYDSKRIVLTANNKFTGKTIDLSQYLPAITKVNSSATSQSVNIVVNSSNNSIKAGKNSDTISGGDGKDTIFGGAGSDSIFGGNDNDILKGDAGNDTLAGGSGNDTLTGGAGNDVFVYDSGNDVITDYTAGQDSIKVNGSISNVSYIGKNVIFSIGSGSLTVNNAKGKNISVSESNGSSHSYSRTLDLFYDNNFLSDDFTLDSVVDVSDTNYSFGKIYYSDNNDEFTANSVVAASSDFK